MKWYEVHYLLDEYLVPTVLKAYVFAGTGTQAEFFFRVIHPHGPLALKAVALLVRP